MVLSLLLTHPLSPLPKILKTPNLLPLLVRSLLSAISSKIEKHSQIGLS
jgi:hypothetical protein